MILMAPDIKEFRIKKVDDLSPSARQEVVDKLTKIRATGTSFHYAGYAKVSYIENSPLTVVSVDPIEGTILDVYKNIMANIKRRPEVKTG